MRYDVVIVGAGFGGIGAAIELNRLGYDNVVILEREDEFGGTWHVNHYPGLAVDIPSTTYSYWFEPNPYWSRLFAPGDELKRYADHVADKYDLRRFMRFNTTVEGARWDEDAQVWQVALAGGETLTARFLVTATGFLSQPHMPEIPGIDGFDGKVMHTADWDDSHDFRARRVGVIGTGATAIQLIPELATRLSELTVYQRTAIWVVPRLTLDSPRGAAAFRPVAALQRILRWVTDGLSEIRTSRGAELPLFQARQRRRNRTCASSSCSCRSATKRCGASSRRTTNSAAKGRHSNDYFRTFSRPHVRLEAAGNERIDPDGIVTTDGHKAEIDTLVLATGFDLWDANFPAIEVVGRQAGISASGGGRTGSRHMPGSLFPTFPTSCTGQSVRV